MADGNLGNLWLSLDIKSDIDKKISNYAGKIGSLQGQIEKLQKAYEKTGKSFSKLERGSEAWLKSKDAIRDNIKDTLEAIRQVGIYREALERVQRIKKRFKEGDTIGKPPSFLTKMETRPIEEAISKYERLEKLMLRLQEVEGRKPRNVMDFVYSDRAGNKDATSYKAAMETYRNQIAALRTEINSLGGEGKTLSDVRSQLDSLYNTLTRFDEANQRLGQSTRNRLSRAEMQKELNATLGPIAQRDKEAMDQLAAAERRQAEQERANRANIEATNAARQRQVQLLREQSAAMANSRINNLEAQRRQLVDLYSQGRKFGMDQSDLDAIIQKYRELSQELLNLRSIMQHADSMPYRDLSGMGRNGASYVREASEQVVQLRNRTLEAVSAARELASAFSRVHESALRSNQVLSDIKSMFFQGGLVFGAQQFANSIIQTGGDIVQQHVALRSILGDIQKADELFQQTQQLALQSPFTFQELNRDVKQLAAFGVDTDRLYDTTKRLADVASGLGVSFERLGLAYGQVKARSWLDAKELRQFAYAGLPMLQKIADYYNETGKDGRNNYTTSDVRGMITKREVSFEDVDQVIKRLTDEGGQFYNMQFVLSNTLLGRWNKLRDAWSIMLGKFADGETILGRTFSTAINGATQLVLALDKISPLLLSFGAAYAGRRMIGYAGQAMGIGVTGMMAQMERLSASQVRRYAVTQMQAVAEGKIEASLAAQNVLQRAQVLQSTTAKDVTYAQLFAEGNISTMQLAQLLRRGQISEQLIAQLRTMGLINAEEEKLILLAGQESGVRGRNLAMMQLGARGGLGKLGGLFSTANVAMLAATVGLAFYTSISQWIARVRQQVDAGMQHAKQQAKEIGDAISSAEKSDVSEQTVKSMQEVVESSDLYTRSMQEQVEKAGTLNEKYNALLSVMRQIKEESDAIPAMSGDIQSAIKGSSVLPYGLALKNDWKNNGINVLPDLLGVNWLLDFGFNDDINQNIGQYSASNDQLSNSVSMMQNYAGQIHNVMESIRGEYRDTYDEIKNKPFDEQLRILSESDAWDVIVDKISESDASFKGLAKTYQDNARTTADDLSEIVNDDVPRMMMTLAYRQNMSLEEFKQFCKEHPKYTAEMIHGIVSSLNEGSSSVKQKLVGVLLEFFGIAGQEAAKIRKEAVKTQYDEETSVGKHLLGKVIAKYGQGKVSVKDINKVAGTDDDYASAFKNIQSQYSQANDNYEYAKRAGVKGAELAALKAERDKRYMIASANGVEVTSKAQKEAERAEKKRAAAERAAEAARNKAEAAKRRAYEAARKADNEEEKSLRARLDLIDKAYESYHKYYNLMHDEEAAAQKVSSQYKDKGLSNDDVSKIKSMEGYRSLVEDYVTRAKSVKYRHPEEMKDRRDADIAEGVQKLNQIDYDALQEATKDFASTMDRGVDSLEKTFNNFMSIYNATGNPELAGSITGMKNRAYAMGDVSFSGFNPYVKRFSDFLKNYIDQLLLSESGFSEKKAFSVKDILSMNDMEIQRYAGSLLANSDPKKVEGLADAMKKLRDVIMDSEYKEGIETFSDIMRGIVTSAADVARENASYDAKLSKLGQAGLNQNDYIKAKGILDAQHDTALLKASKEYKQFMDDVASMTQTAADAMKNRIIHNLDMQLQKGIITTDQYIESLRKVDEQMNAFNNTHSNAYAFATGGLQGLADNIKNTAYSTIRKNEGGKYWKNGELTEAGHALATSGSSFASSVAGVDAIVNGINNNVQSYKELEKTWTDAFGNGLQNSKFSNFMGGFTEASQGAADAWNNLKSGNFVGMFDGVVRSFTGWFSWGNAATNKRYEKQAEYYKKFLSVMNDISSSLEKRVSSSYGSESISSARKLNEAYKAEAEEARKSYRDWSQAHTITRNHRNRMYLFDNDKGTTKKTLSDINAYLRGNGYTGDYVYGDTLQDLDGKWLKMIKEDMPDAWAKLNDDARGYLDTIIESEDATEKLKDANDKLIETLTGMTTDSLMQDWASLLGNLDSSTDDFVDNLEKKLQSAILSGMVSNLYKDKLDAALQSFADLGKNDTYIDKYGNVKKHTNRDSQGNLLYNEGDIASEYTKDEYDTGKQALEDISSDMRATRDMLKDYYDWGETGSSTTASSIKGITEQTADLLASYLNAIRADVSVIRQLEVADVESINITTQAQLQELSQIARNTALNAEIAGRMESAVSNMNDILNGAKNGTKALAVKVQ